MAGVLPLPVSALAGEPSGAAVTIAITPAATAAGDATLKDSAFDVTGESFTVIWAVPGCVKRLAGIVACIFTLLPNDADRAVVFQ